MILLKKKINWTDFISKFVFFSLCIATISIIVIMIFAPSKRIDSEPFKRIKSDYVLMLAQCVLGIVAIQLPKFLKEKIDLKIPSDMMLLYVIFLYAAIYLGEVRNFYYHIPKCGKSCRDSRNTHTCNYFFQCICICYPCQTVNGYGT